MTRIPSPGVFYNNRPDGKGTRYCYNLEFDRYDATSHAIWDSGRILEELDEAFVPSSNDLPAVSKYKTRMAETNDVDLDDNETEDGIYCFFISIITNSSFVKFFCVL